MACHQPRRGLLIFFTSFQGSGQIIVHCAQHSHPPTPSAPRRALVPGEHILIVCVPRARRTSGRSLCICILISLTLKRRAWLNPRTARNVLTRPPTGTPRRASGPGEGLRRPRVARAKGISQALLSLPQLHDRHAISAFSPISGAELRHVGRIF